MPVPIPVPNISEPGLDGLLIEIEKPTGFGRSPQTSRLTGLFLAATTLGAAQTALLPIPPPSNWTEYREIAPLPGSRRAIAMPRSASEKLARIRANLSLSVAELARVLQVERPTIYAWMRDDSVSPRAENRFRLDQLHGLARRWERLSNLPIGKLVREANDAGDSLVSLLEAERFEDAAQFLEPIALRAKEGAVRRVPSVRESLERHGLAGRVRASQEEIDRVSR